MSVLYAVILGGALSAVFAAMLQIKRARDAKRMRAELEHLLTRVPKLLEAVEVMHQCKAVHVESVPVIEMFGKKTVWEGVVEVFNITGHPKAERCYAWSFPEGTETRFVTVLE